MTFARRYLRDNPGLHRNFKGATCFADTAKRLVYQNLIFTMLFFVRFTEPSDPGATLVIPHAQSIYRKPGKTALNSHRVNFDGLWRSRRPFGPGAIVNPGRYAQGM